MATYFREDNPENRRRESRRQRRNKPRSRLVACFQEPLILCSIIVAFGLLIVSNDLHRQPVEEPPPDGHLLSSNRSDRMRMFDFWDNFDPIVSTMHEYDTWYYNVHDITDTLDKAFLEVPPEKFGDPKKYEEMKNHIEERKIRIRLSDLEFRKFLEARERILYNMVGENVLMRVYIDGEPLYRASSKSFGVNWDTLMQKLDSLRLFKAQPTNSSAHNEEPVIVNGTHDNSTNVFPDKEFREAVVLIARGITEELTQIHTNLFKYWDSKLSHVREARRLELLFIKDLPKLSRVGHIIGPYPSMPLVMLQGRLESLQGFYAKTKEMLPWLRKQFILNGPDEIEDWTSWLQSATELLRGWGMVSRDVQESVVYMLRQKDILTKQPQRSCAEASWLEWKLRNCGATSCYNEPAPWDLAIISSSGKPIAKVAEDESNWVQSLGGDGTLVIPRSVYEKACCKKDAELHERLKLGKSQPPMIRRSIDDDVT
ncbi:hypothetical protein F5B22DRAFT_657290 [Xylaria bambusicola]|uniref:uncharacterized protein n=1 Tax=Xylaria bambusicola TaxID=326684 RepID=UPI00200884BD|nr:uncharacterized protein F5B22DRAFT_657290 [Xylaria bambusicola]KAI0513136.1 hypothetical protein F5B22DRAFT_657290 [Xylaria bambusicola]